MDSLFIILLYIYFTIIYVSSTSPYIDSSYVDRRFFIFLASLKFLDYILSTIRKKKKSTWVFSLYKLSPFHKLRSGILSLLKLDDN